MTDSVNSAGTCSQVVCLPAAGAVGAWARLLLTYFAVAYDQVVFAIRTKTGELTFLLKVYGWSELTKMCLRVQGSIKRHSLVAERMTPRAVIADNTVMSNRRGRALLVPVYLDECSW